MSGGSPAGQTIAELNFAFFGSGRSPRLPISVALPFPPILATPTRSSRDGVTCRRSGGSSWMSLDA